jgi:asparagine synthase (glutamine-hydrolysing)
MCGIAGFIGAGDRSDLAAMMSALVHRGPDGQGVYADPDLPAFLGHRRLSIIDIEGGHQPMWNEDGRLGIVFNGEIYNHADLRKELEERGHRFRSSHSDTEVLVHGYEEWGAGLLPRLNGMFAFAILDRERHRLFLARDRFGEKPLYYSFRPGFLGFASELGALARHRAVDDAPDSRSVQKFFAYGYLPAPHTFFRGCRKLPAGHCLTYDIDTDGITLKRYWRFRIEADESLGDRDEPRLVEELRHLLFQATERRLISDVPLGVFLSGGIDSSAILAGVARRLPGPEVETFTIGFTEASFDESTYAREVASAFGTRHHEQILDLETARDLLPSVLSRLDEPLGDASILPTYLLSAFTRKHVTVALSGDGGDELFAGYDPFKALAPATLYSRLVPDRLHAGLRRLAEFLPVSSRNMSLDFKIRRGLMGLSYPQSVWNPVWMSPVEPRDMADLFDEPLRLEELYEEAIAAWEGSGADSLVDRTLEFFTNFYLPEDILTKVDRASMMVSLESRAVFLDNDLVAFCQRLPHRFKFHRGERKYLLKKALADVLPPSILGRRKKGFGIPLASWLRTFPAQPPLGRVAGIRGTEVERRWREHRSGSTDHRLFLWSWLSLQQAFASPSNQGAPGANEWILQPTP